MTEFFVGGVIDPVSGERTGDRVTIESADLVTHGVIVGMTGSGKTGLGIALIEEALMSGVPCLIIDPKGDLGNLALTFPEFRPEDFRPWVEGETEAAKTAEEWRKGLASWEIGPDQMRRLTNAAGVTIYTPGSTAGVPLNVLGSMAAPKTGFDSDPETHRDEIEGVVSAILTLARVEANPVSSPEHILLATIIESVWRAGKDLDLAGLIGQIQTPPVRKLGVFDLDAFFPPRDRTALAMRLNGLVASPSFAAWLEGEPLDIPLLLHRDGRPQAAVIYLAHLSDPERQFVVTLLFSKLVTWMRRQSGTANLRALVYMDEVFGFCPPTAEPPTKKPILTILKQARAFGVGLVLSTQNPVDLDYKAMSNAGTWLIGRLQTQRDKARILEGLESAAGGVDITAADRLIAGLRMRQFLLHSTKRSAPIVLTTRWAMSYLAGPMTREEVKTLTWRAGEAAPASVGAVPVVPMQVAADPVAAEPPSDETPVAPSVAVSTYYLDPAAPWGSAAGADAAGTAHHPAAVATVHVLYDDVTAGVSHRETFEAVIHPLDGTVSAANLHAVDHDPRDFRPDPPPAASYRLPDVPIATKSFWTRLESALRDHLVRERQITIWKAPPLKLYSRVGETEAEFVARCAEAGETAADAEIAKLRDTYADRIDRVQDQLAAADRRIQELESEVIGRRQSEVIGGAGDLLGALLGGRRRSSGLSRAIDRRGQVKRTEQRLTTAEEKSQRAASDLDGLEADLAAEITRITDHWTTAATAFEPVDVGLEKTDVQVEPVGLVWIPGP